jgi:ABC-type polysaccharide/polyol phosphate transport system ATPase subunit
MNKELRLDVRNLSKSFEIEVRKSDSVLEGFVSLFRKKIEKKKINVINNLSFEVCAGEIVGVVGRNGSGKSTLLRILADIYKPDSGKIFANGRIVYLSGFGQGFNPKLSMRENIFLMGSILGLSQKDIKNKYNEIVDFSELNDFSETLVFKFSNGMITRLIFSVMIHCLKHNYPEILLLDEVLDAGGDIDFRKRVNKKIEELLKGGAAIILVSHDMENIIKYCNRVILMDNGNILMEGRPQKVVEEYINSFK